MSFDLITLFGRSEELMLILISQLAQIVQLDAEIEKLNHYRRVDEANIRELSGLKKEYKLKDLDLKSYQSHAAALNEILEEKD